jgi:UrcA family protein
MTLKQICLIVAAMTAGAAAAHAGPVNVTTETQDTAVVHVRTADLDLTQDPGARVMWGRIKEAAHEVCGPAPVLQDLDQQQPYEQCLTTTEARAVQRLGSTRVAQISHLSPSLLYASR